VTTRVLSFAVSRILVEQSLLAEGHGNRIPRYVRVLAGAVEGTGEYARLKDDAYVELLAGVAPAHDVGLLGVPRGVLMKPDRLDSDERSVVETHTTQGADLFLAVAGKFVAEVPSLPMAVEVARSHHERWDGTGYPDRLAGAEIPLAARVVGLVSVYEAVRSRRPYRPALGHSRAVQAITAESPGQFDPVLVAAFAKVAAQFDQIQQRG
jgi:HD-GYP domain-containing protein (c-di-GMP phosphodiesterase class II)